MGLLQSVKQDNHVQQRVGCGVDQPPRQAFAGNKQTRHQQPWELFPVEGSKEHSGGWGGVCGFKAWNSWVREKRCKKKGTLRIRIISRNMEKAHLEQCKEGTKIFQQLLVMLRQCLLTRTY